MNKVIVNIVSQQSVPNYLFIREMYEEGDSLMFISSQKMAHNIDDILQPLKDISCVTERIVFENENDEEKWAVMCDTVSKRLFQDKKYFVNLTGGTKYMALAIQSVFEKFNSSFFYIPYPKNIILSSQEARPIKYRIKVEEYMQIHGKDIRYGNLLLPETDYTTRFFDQFVNHFNTKDFDTINLLRSYRNIRRGASSMHISEIEAPEKTTDKKPAIPALSVFLSKIQFPVREKGALSAMEAQYITGGWFEEYVYSLIKTNLNPTDIKFGVKFKATNNDLDVVFTLGNKLFVVECKTGVERESMLKEIVYKASALKDFIRGLSASSYIFALSSDNDQWSVAAQNMSIDYYGRETFLDSEKLQKLLESIKRKSFEE